MKHLIRIYITLNFVVIWLLYYMLRNLFSIIWEFKIAKNNILFHEYDSRDKSIDETNHTEPSYLKLLLFDKSEGKIYPTIFHYLFSVIMNRV